MATITTTTLATTVCLGEDAWLDLAELARACGTEPGFIGLLIEEGLVEPAPAGLPDAAPPPAVAAADEAGWRFGGEALARVRRIQRLQRDFEASLASVGLMLDLLDEIDRLRGRLQRAGLAT